MIVLILVFGHSYMMEGELEGIADLVQCLLKLFHKAFLFWQARGKPYIVTFT